METTTDLSYYTLLKRNKQFRRIWLAQVVSELGDWLNLVALLQLVARYSTKAQSIGLVLILQTLPFVVWTPISGYVADLWNRKHIMMVMDVLRALVVLGFLLVNQSSRLWLAYVLAALQFTGAAFFEPARSALIPSLTREEERVTANALSSVTWSILFTLGTALGGVLATLVRPEVAFILDAGTFLSSAFILSRVCVPLLEDLRKETSESGGEAVSLKQSRPKVIREILSALREKKRLFALLLVKAGFTITGGGIWMMAGIYGQRIYIFGQEGSISVGLLYAAIGIGAIVGSLCAASFLKMQGKILWMIFCVYAARIPLFFLLWMAPNLFFVAVACLWHSITGSVLWVVSTTLIQKESKSSMWGRFFAIENALQILGFSGSVQLTGLCLDVWKLSLGQTSLWLGAISAIISVIWLIGLLLSSKNNQR